MRGFPSLTSSLPSSPARITVCSGDSDMQQLLALSGDVTWMETLPWPAAGSSQECGHPCVLQTKALHEDLTGLPVRLHRALAHSSFTRLSEMKERQGQTEVSLSSTSIQQQQQRPQESEGCSVTGDSGGMMGGGLGVGAKGGLTPSSYADFLALVGKPEAGVKGVGLSASAAKTLLRRFGSIEGIAEAVRKGAVDSHLRIVQASSKTTPGSFGPSVTERESERLRQAQRNIRVTRIQCDIGSVRWDMVRSSADEARDKLLSHTSRGLPDDAIAGTSYVTKNTHLAAMLYPHNFFHGLSARPYVEAIGSHLAAQGVGHYRQTLTQSGLLIDVDLIGGRSPMLVGVMRASMRVSCSRNDRNHRPILGHRGAGPVRLLEPSDFFLPRPPGCQ